MKKCPSCSIEKSYNDFYMRKRKDLYNSSAGYSWICKECSKAKQVAYRRNNPLKAKDVDLYQNFGIRIADYNKMFLEQGGCCKICKINQSKLRRALAVDHNHITGQIRGLLCDTCNAGIGYLKADDGIQLLNNAITYISESADSKHTDMAKIISLKKEG